MLVPVGDNKSMKIFFSPLIFRYSFCVHMQLQGIDTTSIITGYAFGRTVTIVAFIKSARAFPSLFPAYSGRNYNTVHSFFLVLPDLVERNSNFGFVLGVVDCCCSNGQPHKVEFAGEFSLYSLLQLLRKNRIDVLLVTAET